MKQNENDFTNFEEMEEEEMQYDPDEKKEYMLDLEELGLKDTMSKDEQIEFLKRKIQGFYFENTLLFRHLYNLQDCVSELKKHIDKEVLMEIYRQKRMERKAVK